MSVDLLATGILMAVDGCKVTVEIVDTGINMTIVADIVGGSEQLAELPIGSRVDVTHRAGAARCQIHGYIDHRHPEDP